MENEPKLDARLFCHLSVMRELVVWLFCADMSFSASNTLFPLDDVCPAPLTGPLPAGKDPAFNYVTIILEAGITHQNSYSFFP